MGENYLSFVGGTIRREYKEDSIKDCRAKGKKGEDSVRESIRASAKIFDKE